MFTEDLRRAMRDETVAYFDYVVRENRDVTGADRQQLHVCERNAGEALRDRRREGRRDASRRVAGRQSARRRADAGDAARGYVEPESHVAGEARAVHFGQHFGYRRRRLRRRRMCRCWRSAGTAITDHQPTIRESQELHRREPLCSSCHARMDPLGLAFENFNAMGMWRDTEQGQPIDASGKLMTGEKFSGIRELKTIIKDKHRLDFYRCLTEKLLTYALGRGLEYYDEHTVDLIVSEARPRAR